MPSLLTKEIFQHNVASVLSSTIICAHVRSVSIPNGYRGRFWQSTKCNGGGTGDIQAGGNNDITAGSLSSVKCYENRAGYLGEGTGSAVVGFNTLC
ncbi:hypothetical protein N7527_008757 [Penicillium freii]|nr:hypothetical protein N7527_008757 [Penicillium freii]